MINLLPLEEKQKLLYSKKEKLAVIWGIVILVSLVCLTLILLSIKFYVLAETDYQKNLLQQAEQKNKTSDFTASVGIMQRYDATLSQLDSFYKKEIYFNQALKIITDVPAPKGLYLTNFSLNRDEKGTVQAGVSGVSDTRDNLLIFKNSIEQSQGIKNPYFSPESWISPKNVNFSLTFGIAQNENKQ